MNILLISVNRQTAPYPVYPLGLDYVAAAIAEKHRTHICDLLTVTREELAGIIKEFAPDLIGLSCRNIDNTDYAAPVSFVPDAAELAAWLRERTRAILVLGGCGFTMMPEVFLRATGADFGIVGEGERLPLLLDALAEGREPTEIEGVVSLANKKDAPKPWPGTMTRRFVASGRHEYYLRHGGMLNLQSKRGCVFRCSYCSYPQIEGNKHRLFDPDEVASEAKLLQESGAKYLFFTDSAFNSDIAHSLAVAHALEKRKLSIRWGAFFAPVPMPDEYFHIMRRSGCKHVEFGSESLSDLMLKSYKKPFTVADVFAAHEKALAAGLHVAHYFLFGGRGESAATLTESLDNIEQLRKTVFFLFTGVRLYPGSLLCRQAIEEGRIQPGDTLAESTFYRPQAISLEEIAAMIQARAAARENWLFGAGGALDATVANLYARGFVGPLWEFLTQ
ncbi:MAG: cobalamin-dependent protein [Desulfobulbaceae bacterium]|jgi:radical SAM superfamily enzyme YgiQ (UPF0313 family)|nr:cobalamin-dependent protein [Desulfobulbaceae bacterium]